MAVKAQDRPIETVRKEAIDQLVMNYSHGELSLEAFERRLDIVMEAKVHDDILEQTADLKLEVDEQFIQSKSEQIGVNYVPGDTKAEERILNVFSDNSRTGQWRLPESIELISVFSCATIDMMEAEFTKPVIKIYAKSIFSSETIYVPEGVNVTTNVFSIFGSVSNDVLSYSNPNAPTVVIEGFSLFSSIEVTVKRSMKERFVEFADKLKAMLS